MQGTMETFNDVSNRFGRRAETARSPFQRAGTALMAGLARAGPGAGLPFLPLNSSSEPGGGGASKGSSSPQPMVQPAPRIKIDAAKRR